MSVLLRVGQGVRAESSALPCVIEEFLGGGSQGEVYRSVVRGKRLAVKWLYPNWATAQMRVQLEELIRKGAPTSGFLWPIDIVSSQELPGFGYIMPLREPRFRSLVDLMKRHVDPSFHILATAGRDLANSFFQLHSMGLCYRDISLLNAFLDPSTGDTLICDNDNVSGDGQPAEMVGTPRFMAPELARGDSSAVPSTQTDLYSLAVLLFHIFMIHHPLDGKKELGIRCLDLPAMKKLYGFEPVFIFDPNDDSNHPVPGYHDNALAFWPIYPQFLRDLFLRSFVIGIRDPANGRVRENQWRAAMVQLSDSIFYCIHCGSENFYDSDRLRTIVHKPQRCWSCKEEIRLPFRIRIGKQVVMLNHDTQLFPHHVDDSRPYDFSTPVAAVSQHPTKPQFWGLKNVTDETWVYTGSDGVPKSVGRGQSATLSPGARVHFGKVEGEMKM